MAETGTLGSRFSFLTNNALWMQKTDMLVGLGVITVVSMLVVPLPTIILDFLMAISIMIGLLVLMMVMFVQKPYDFSIFPALLLITTVFRLALNVSTSRLILLKGAGFDGKIVRTFGEFVVGGNYVIGFIIFIILVAVQYIVITKGATRTAEVAARFTLDAMPGKQMSIDSDLSNGAITEDEAKKRREEIRREADFYGAMDGASKFIQGDVKVGIIIILVNIIGGFIVGMVLRNESFDVALKTYTLLSIGDGLVAQIPSLLITTATGIIVTRAASNDTLGKDFSKQLSSEPRALYITAAALGIMVFIPGFPKITLILLSVGLGSLAYILTQEKEEKKDLEEKKVKESAMKDHKPESVVPLIQVDSLEVEIGYNLVPLVDPEQGGTLLDRITNIRRRFALDMGLIVPPIRIRDNMELEPEYYSILIKGVEVGSGALQVGKLMAMDSGDIEDKISGTEFIEPAFELKAIWIESEQRDLAESKGYNVVDCPTIIATHLTEIIRRHAAEILGRQEVKQIIDKVKTDFPAVVDEIQEKKITVGEIQKVLQNLLRERVSIRNMVTILETIATYSEHTRNAGVLTEYVRVSLARQITKNLTISGGALSVITIDPEIESVIRTSIHDDPIDGMVLALDPETHNHVINSLIEAYNKTRQLGFAPIYLVSPHIRSVAFTLLEREISAPIVLSYNEITNNVKVNVVASALMSNAA